MVHRAVAADQTGSVKAQSHGQALQRCFLESLVKGPLHERGIDREEGLEARLGQARHHVERVAFADANVP